MARRERELRHKAGLSNSDDPSSVHLDNMSGMSDDSGISSSSSPINGISANVKESASIINNNNMASNVNVAFNRSHTVNPTNPSVHQLMPLLKLTRTMSTPQIFTPTTKRFNVHSGQKGLMQRFIASRGKFSPAGNNRNKDSILVSGLILFQLNKFYLILF